MKRFIIMSIMIATFVIPILAAQHESARIGLARTKKRFLIFCVLYVITILYILPRI